MDTLGTTIPHLKLCAGGLKAISYLEKENSTETDTHNELAKLYIEEALEGRLSPIELVKFLRRRPMHYDPEYVLSLFPNQWLQKERCVLLDIL
jgi:hypothetical protein